VLFQAEPFSVHTIGDIRFDFIHIFRQTASIWTSMSEKFWVCGLPPRGAPPHHHRRQSSSFRHFYTPQHVMVETNLAASSISLYPAA